MRRRGDDVHIHWMTGEPQEASASGEAVLGMADIRPLRATLHGLAAVVAPTSLVTSLLYYFGWARTSTQASVLGLDDSLLGFSFQDYLLRSIDPMFWPLFFGMVALLAGLGLHAALIGRLVGRAPSGGPLQPADRRLCLLVVTGILVGAGLSLLFGAVGVNVARPSRAVSITSPLCVTGGIALAAYAVLLWRRFLGRPSVGAAATELRALRLGSATVLVALLFLSVFWSVARYAEVKGIDLALVLERQLRERPDVVVYSAGRLQLEPPVEERVLPGEDPVYRYRYSGLKLLFRSGDRYFLRPSDPAVSVANVVLTDGDDLRFEFTRGQ